MKRPNFARHVLRNFVVAALLFMTMPWLYAQLPQRSAVRSLSYIPRDAMLVLNINPKQMANSELMNTVYAQAGSVTVPFLDVALTEVEDVTFALLMSEQGPQPIAKIQLTAHAVASAVKRLNGRLEKVQIGRHTAFVSDHNGAYVQLDAQTLLYTESTSSLVRCLQTQSAETCNWAEAWNQSTAPATLLVNSQMLRGNPMVLDAIMTMGDDFGAGFSNLPWRLAPIWDASNYLLVELNPSDQLELHIHAECPHDLDAKQVQTSLLTALSFGRTGLSVLRGNLAEDADASAGFIPLIDIVDQSLELARIETRENRLSGLIELDTTQGSGMVEQLTKGLAYMGRAQSRVQDMNRMKQVALAMHNYESVYRKLPAAVQLGPADTPRSWRVTLLPFIEQANLYESYSQDVAWDSLPNSQLIKQIPEVYAAADGPVGVTDMMVFNGPGAIFNGNVNPRFAEITDGTSNTILCVQANFGVLWTEPRDIPFESGQPLPEIFLQQGMTVATADGAVHRIPPNADPTELEHAILKSDGNIQELFRR